MLLNFSHRLEKSLNLESSPWKILEFYNTSEKHWKLKLFRSHIYQISLLEKSLYVQLHMTIGVGPIKIHLSVLSYNLKNHANRGGCYRPRVITRSEICLILWIMRKSNTIILLFKVIHTLKTYIPQVLVVSRIVVCMVFYNVFRP